MKNKTLFRIAIIQLLILLLFMALTLGNEIIDIPHYLLDDIASSRPETAVLGALCEAKNYYYFYEK